MQSEKELVSEFKHIEAEMSTAYRAQLKPLKEMRDLCLRLGRENLELRHQIDALKKGDTDL